MLWCVHWSRGCIDLSSCWVFACVLYIHLNWLVTAYVWTLPLLLAHTYLVGVVRVDEVESTGRRAAEWGGAAGMRLLGVSGLRGSVGVWQLAERRERRRRRRRGREDRGWNGGQAAESISHWIRVELDLRVVEVLLAVAAVRVTVTPENIKRGYR